MSSGFVASEIHQDSLFLDGLGEHIFDEEAAEEGDTDDPDREN